MPTYSRNNSELSRSLFTFVALTAFYLLLRLPSQGLGLQYLDDAEALYHTLNILEGGVPYRHDHSHHFLGYLWEYLLVSFFIDFSGETVRYVALLNQSLLGFVTFYAARKVVSFWPSFLAGLLIISAREPWQIGFYIQHQLNLIAALVLLSGLYAIKYRSHAALVAQSALLGFGLVCDQRMALLFPTIILSVLLAPVERNLFNLLRYGIALSLAPFLGLVYLTMNSAIGPFLEQTLIYPKRYRIGSIPLSESLRLGLSNLGYIFSLTPLLGILGSLGLLASAHGVLRDKIVKRRRKFTFLLLSLPCFIAIPFLAGRDYDYYCVSLFPILAIGAAYALDCVRHHKILFPAFVAITLLLPLGNTLRFRDARASLASENTGSQELVKYLRETVPKDRSLFVWGYRPDIYVALKKLSPLPYMNQIMIHPDTQIEGREQREKHIFMRYSDHFRAALLTRKPDFIVTVDEGEQGYSEAHEFVLRILSKEYTLEKSLVENNMLNKRVAFKVYKISNKAHHTSNLPNPGS